RNCPGRDVGCNGSTNSFAREHPFASAWHHHQPGHGKQPDPDGGEALSQLSCYVGWPNVGPHGASLREPSEPVEKHREEPARRATSANVAERRGIESSSELSVPGLSWDLLSR